MGKGMQIKHQIELDKRTLTFSQDFISPNITKDITLPIIHPNLSLFFLLFAWNQFWTIQKEQVFVELSTHTALEGHIISMQEVFLTWKIAYRSSTTRADAPPPPLQTPPTPYLPFFCFSTCIKRYLSNLMGKRISLVARCLKWPTETYPQKSHKNTGTTTTKRMTQRYTSTMQVYFVLKDKQVTW